MPKKILIATIGSLGDLHPFIALGAELKKRGHQIKFTTSKDYKEKIDSQGFEFYQLRPDDISPTDKEALTMMMDSKNGPKAVIKNYIMKNIEKTYDDLHELSKDVDLIIAGELVYAAKLVAEKLDKKWVFVSLSPISFFSSYDSTFFNALGIKIHSDLIRKLLTPALMTFGNVVTSNWSKPYYQLRKKLNLKNIGNPIINKKFSKHLNLALFSSTFADKQKDWIKNVQLTGFTFHDGSMELEPDLLKFLESGETPLVFTLGSAAVVLPGEFYNISIKVAKILNKRAVMLIGDNEIPNGLTDDIVAFKYAPYSKIFPKACLIIHQGGIGTTAQALKAGIPTIVMPFSHDQPDNAFRLEKLNTSITLKKNDFSVDNLVNTIKKILNSSKYIKSAGLVSEKIKNEDGLKFACDLIEKLIKN